MISSSKTARYTGLRKVVVFPVAFAAVLAFSWNGKAQQAPHSEVSVLPSTSDTIPKKSGEPITVSGYSLKKKGKQPATPPAAAESLKPKTVTGKKLEKKEPVPKEAKKGF